MRRFILLLRNEFVLARTTLPIHLIAILQPSLIYLLMALVLVSPTFDINVAQPTTAEGNALIAAMQEVGSPVGDPYINPVIVSLAETAQMDASTLRQVVIVESVAGIPTATQRFGLIDSNQVKNLRNRLTAAALRLWDQALGSQAVTVEEHPWLPRDVPYMVYFGMAMLPTTTFMAAAFIGGILTAQDFEFQTIGEYRLAPTAHALILGARLVRLILSALLAAGVLLLAVGWRTGFWPDSLWRVILILLPQAIIASSLAVTAGLVLRRSIPTLLVGLLTSLGGWILGSAFGLAGSFGGLYETVSYLIPNTYVVLLLFPRYYGIKVGTPYLPKLALGALSAAMLSLVALVYRWRVTRME